MKRSVAILIFFVVLVVIGTGVWYFFFRKKTVKLPMDDPNLVAARNNYEAQMLSKIKARVETWARDWFDNAYGAKSDNPRTPSDEEILEDIRQAGTLQNGVFIYNDSAGVKRWEGPVRLLYGY